MSVLHSIVPIEQIYQEQVVLNQREERVYDNMLVEVEFSQENIVLSRIIDGPLSSYLSDKYMPGTIIGKKYS